jgi:uncharacterized membrane protein YbhN (UPF0104 family)
LLSYLLCRLNLIIFKSLSGLLGTWCLLVLLLYPTRDGLLAHSLWKSYWMYPKCFLLWSQFRKLHIFRWCLSYTNAKYNTRWFWNIPWSPSIWYCVVNKYFTKDLAHFLVGPSKFEVCIYWTLCRSKSNTLHVINKHVMMLHIDLGY